MKNKISKFKGEYDFLSNFYPCFVEFEGKLFPSVEHAFQAAKTLDAKIRKGFAVCPSPAYARSLGREINLRPDWEDVKIDIMTQLVKDKFTRNRARKDIRQLLLNTKDAIIEEGNNHGDTFWGVVNGEGRNELGKILMQVRDGIRERK